MGFPATGGGPAKSKQASSWNGKFGRHQKEELTVNKCGEGKEGKRKDIKSAGGLGKEAVCDI